MTAHERAEHVKSGLYDAIQRHLVDSRVGRCDLLMNSNYKREDEIGWMIDWILDNHDVEVIQAHLRPWAFQ